MSGGGGIGQLLPMALAIGATVATDGAAAPLLEEQLGATGGAMLTQGLLGAGTQGLGAALTGGDIGRSALMGGLGGAATAGIMSGLNASTATPVTPDIASSSVPPTSQGLISNPNAGLTALNPSGPTLSDSGLYNPQTQFSLSPSGAPSSLTPTVDSSLSSGISKGNITPTIDKYGSSVPSSDSFFDKPYNTPTGYKKYLPQTVAALAAGDLFKQPGITPAASVTGGVPDALKFNFDTQKYKPAVAPYYNGIDSIYPQTPHAQQIRGYADGGTVEQMSRENAMGGNEMFPQAGLSGLTGMNRFQNATNTPMGTDVLEPTDAVTDPYTGQMKFAEGGIMNYAHGGDLGSYSDGGRMLKGPGDGMSDDIPASIGNKQPARLADGEFVIPADVVSHLGNGSTDAGAKHLYAMMNKVRKARTGNPKQGKQINPNKYLTA
jgi:hypothetical protein